MHACMCVCMYVCMYVCMSVEDPAGIYCVCMYVCRKMKVSEEEREGRRRHTPNITRYARHGHGHTYRSILSSPPASSPDASSAGSASPALEARFAPPSAPAPPGAPAVLPLLASRPPSAATSGAALLGGAALLAAPRGPGPSTRGALRFLPPPAAPAPASAPAGRCAGPLPKKSSMLGRPCASPALRPTSSAAIPQARPLHVRFFSIFYFSGTFLSETPAEDNPPPRVGRFVVFIDAPEVRSRADRGKCATLSFQHARATAAGEKRWRVAGRTATTLRSSPSCAPRGRARRPEPTPARPLSA